MAALIDVHPSDTSVLGWVNAVRASQGRSALSELVPGVPGSACDCVIARSLGGDAEVFPSGSPLIGGTFDLGLNRDASLPIHVNAFALKFDHLAYPDLIAEDS